MLYVSFEENLYTNLDFFFKYYAGKKPIPREFYH